MTQASNPMAADVRPQSALSAQTLALRMLLSATAALRGAQATGYEFHKGAFKADLWSLRLLHEQFPHALGAALHILNEGVDPLTGAVLNKHLAAAARPIAEQLIANLAIGPEHLYDGVLPADFNGQEAVRAASGHDSTPQQTL